jgi:DNA-binding MarR family transcriptional regulator
MSATAKKRQAPVDSVPARAPARSGADNDALDLGVLSDVMGFRFRRIQNHLARAFMTDPRHGDLKPGLFSILALIAANPGVSQTRLAEEAGIDQTPLVSLIDDLEEAGWALRARSRQDRRRHSLHVTSKGSEALARLTVAAYDAESKVRSALTQKELDQLLKLLDKLYTTCIRGEDL